MKLRELTRLIHWGPLLALTVIGTISSFTIHCVLQWWPLYTLGGAVNFIVYLSWNMIVLYNFFNATFVGPGHVPQKYKPAKEDLKYIQFCNICEGYKAPRSHHCRKCQKCVMKMDHHCPWINNCVGHRNHGSFTLFLFFAPFGCIHSLFILIPAMYRAVNRTYYASLGVAGGPLVTLTFPAFFGCLLSVSFAIGVSIAVWFLCYIQVKSILKNETGIESWICDKAEYRDREEEEEEFVFPYHMGRWLNFQQVIHWTPRLELDGTWWPVKEGCDQYTLTKEQIAQKREKRERSILYQIRDHFSGSICPITKGLKVFCCPPCTDEPRIKTVPGDQILVSRWKRHWLYGDKLLKPDELKDKKRVRGWFPRKCAIEVMRECDHKEEETKEEEEEVEENMEKLEDNDIKPVENDTAKDTTTKKDD